MIHFLTKGLLRDRSRSLFPVIIITITVTIVIFAIGFMRGSMNNVFLDTAVIISGHEKIVTRAYKEDSQMLPNDLALLDVDQIIINLKIDVFINQKFTREIKVNKYKNVRNSREVIIIGAGPAGLFAALKLIENGIKPIIIERGKKVRNRRKVSKK